MTAGPPGLGAEPGLCGGCQHAKIGATRRGTAYLRCLAAASDPRLEKYPRLPRLACPGFLAAEGDAGPDAAGPARAAVPDFRHGPGPAPAAAAARPAAAVIRNVVVGRLRPAADPAQRAADAARLDEGLAAIAALRFPGLMSVHVGTDLGLRAGGWSFAITSDWADAAAYQAYDADEEHNRIRREYFAAICSDLARVQFPLGS